MEQISVFDKTLKPFKVIKPIRLIELFAGYGSQHLALKYLGEQVESWKICEWAVKSIQAYKDMHCHDDNVDYSKGVGIDFIYNALYERGISSNYNKPMTLSQIKRLGEQKARTIFNNIIATKNLVNIQKTTAKSLEIVDRDEYTYLMTYSFPCQDLSLAGKGAGMERDSGTRSGMLWEVERILEECNGNLPQVLLMENVPQVHGKKNLESFNEWKIKLESLGYKNFYKDLNAKNYGIPQNRNRCFMVSVLGDYEYKFPKEEKLELKLKDLLEDEVDEKYYLSDKMKNYIVANNEKWTGNNVKSLINKEIASTLNTAEGQRRCDASNYICNELPNNFNLKQKMCNDLIQSGKVKENDVIRHSYSTSRMNGQMKDIQQNNISPTLDTRCDCLGVCVKEPIACELRCDEGIRTFKDNVMGTLRTIDACGCKHIIENKPFIKSNNKRIHSLANKMDKDKDCQFMDIYNQNTIENECGTLKAGMDHQQGNIIYNDLRIRKLTPKECFRIMGVKDEDFERVAQNQSNASLYHLAGDSICTSVLMAIFNQMF